MVYELEYGLSMHQQEYTTTVDNRTVWCFSKRNFIHEKELQFVPILAAVNIKILKLSLGHSTKAQGR